MNGSNNSKPCNYVYFFLLALLAITSFGFGTYYTEARMLKAGGVANLKNGAVENEQAQQQEPTRPEIDPTLVPSVSETDRVRGNQNAKIAIIEYSDLECPFCQSFHGTVKQALEEYPDDVKWVYRHFPLGFHPDAMPRAQAAECVAEQYGNEAFWAFVDQIFSDPNMQVNAESAATKLGYNYSNIEACVKSNKYKELIDTQTQDAQTANITGTPGAIVINTETKQAVAIPGALPYEQVKAAIEQVK